MQYLLETLSMPASTGENSSLRIIIGTVLAACTVITVGIILLLFIVTYTRRKRKRKLDKNE